MKEFISFVKTLWQNKRTRSLAILIMYFIFFLFAFSYIGSLGNHSSTSSNNNGEPIEPSEPSDKPNIKEDEFHYLTEIEIINYNIYDNIAEVTDFNEELIDEYTIYELVKNSTLESTNYIENSNTYYISINDYERLVNGDIVSIDGGIRITIKENNIILDFSSYYGYKVNIDIRS